MSRYRKEHEQFQTPQNVWLQQVGGKLGEERRMGCPICGENVAMVDGVCPNCGTKHNKQLPKWRVILVYVLAILGLLFLASLILFLLDWWIA